MSYICVNQAGMLELKWIIKFWFCSFLAFKAFHKLSQLWKSSRKSPLTLRLHSPKAYFFSLLKSCFIQHIAWEPYRDKTYRERVVRNFHSQSCCEHYRCQFSWDRMTMKPVSLRHTLWQQWSTDIFSVLIFFGESYSKPMCWKSGYFCFMGWSIRVKKFHSHYVIMLNTFTFRLFK